MKNTKQKQTDVTGTEAQETSGPVGVGELATPVVISSSGYAQSNRKTEHLEYNDTDKLNRYCYSAPLRLRGGWDEDDENVVEMSDKGSTSGDMVTASRSQRHTALSRLS